MNIVHVKSPCCRARAIRFGGKRRQCSTCDKTFTIRPKRRGRHRIRHTNRYVSSVFERDFSVKQLTHGSVSLAAVQKRFQRALSAIVSKPRLMRLYGKMLVLIIDARWHLFNGQRWTMYFLAVKSINRDEVILLDPILRPGKESAAVWRETIDKSLSSSVKHRTVALISDGIAGGKGMATQFGWRQQRCHFHLLKELEKRRGKRKRLPGWTIREQIYQDVRELLRTETEKRKTFLTDRLKRLSAQKECPKKIRMIVNELFENLPEFHLYLTHPEWNLPNTTGVMESLGNMIRAGVKKARTPEALIRWATAVIRSHPKLICKRTNYQQN